MVTAATLGLDLGTSGVRAVVLGGAGAASGAVRLGPAERRDPAALWDAVCAALAGLDLSGVGALAVAGTSGTLLPVRADGSPAAGLSLYSDPDPPGAARLPPGRTASALARAVALRAAPGAIRILHEADWIAGGFLGRFDASDWNNALKTGYDPQAEAWPDWVEVAGMPAAMLPRVVAPGTPLGRVTPGVAARLGLPAGAVVAAGTTDGCASFLAAGADGVGDGVTALGSTTTLKLLSDAPVTGAAWGIYSHRLPGGAHARPPHARTPLEAAPLERPLLERLWLPGGASNAGGAVLAQFFAPSQIEGLSRHINPAQPSPYDYYPLPSPGERFPINDPALPPRLLPRPVDDADFLHGLLEGIAGIEALGYRRLMECGAPPLRRVLTTGGGAANPAWTAIRARVLGVPVSAADGDAATGAAMLARRALAAAPAPSPSGRGSG